MNIFFLDEDPCEAACSMIDKHIIKMRAECIQMIAATHKRYGVDLATEWPKNSLGNVYKGGYENHPCTRWVGAGSANYQWTIDHLYALEFEYSFRYNKWVSHTRGILDYLSIVHDEFIQKLPQFKSISFPALAMPLIYYTPWENPDPVLSYRAYYKGAKTKDKNGNSMLKYTIREMPEWMMN